MNELEHRLLGTLQFNKNKDKHYCRICGKPLKNQNGGRKYCSIKCYRIGQCLIRSRHHQFDSWNEKVIISYDYCHNYKSHITLYSHHEIILAMKEILLAGDEILI